MIKKIGRNEPCPCGSGKKYKNCCINAGLVKENKEKLESIEKERNETLRYIESHSSGLILNTIISLQLMPENHGKNVRIEELAKHIATNLNSHEDSNLELFKSYLDKEYSKNMMEDIPENLFCENIVFFGGNYPVFSGISSYSIEILRNLSETIFSYKNDLPTEFTSHVYSGLKLMLELGQILANKLNIKGNIPGIETERKFNYLKNNLDFSIDKNEIQSICEDYGIEPSIINDFIISPNDEKYKFEDIDLNPLLYYPIVQFDNKYYYLLISNQANTLNEFILRLSGFYKCNQKLVSLYHDNNWREIWHACDRMNWQLTDIKIPVDKSATIKERIFQFDTNRLAFVSYLHNNKTNSRYERYEERYVDDSSDINDRIQEVINYLKTNKNFKDFKFLSLITYDNIGQELFLGINGPQENELRLTFASSQFIQLSTTEKWNTLSLWKFAKTFESFSKTTRTISDTLDIYSLYAAKEESLYFSDDAPANILTVVPGDGSRLTKESKLKQNLHGIIALIDNRLAYVPTTRSADYAPLYEPIHTLEFYAICLEIYDFPVWISNRQIKNNSMTKTVRTYAEAIGFWLFKLEPMIKSPLNKIINKPLEIEITLDDEFFKNEPVPEMKNNPSDDTYSFHYESNKIQFYVPHDTLYSLQGSNNEGERTMMKTLLSSFNLIDNLFSYEEITIAIDNAIPLGNAKMILLSHTQKDLMIDNRWLIRPLYISKAEINMILDELPILIEEKIKVPENIESTEKKKELFNIATTILLDKLHTEINVFDFEFLLDCLIELHETLVWKRENNKTIIPAQILCFGDREGKVNEILDNEIRLANTSLSLRCLIEYVASSPTKGSIKSSNDDIDRLLALMHEIVTYGFLSDSIHFKMNNPKVGKLKSGRIGISRDFFDDKLRPFSVAHTKEEIDNYIENFDSRFHSFDTSPKPAIETDGDAELDLINNAFLNDWGIGYSTIYKFCYSCAMICISDQKSVTTASEDDLIKKLIEEFKLEKEEVIAGINHFSISERSGYLIAPEGFNNSEVFPWKYNREFSFSRRFIVRYKGKDDKVLLKWGFRNAISSEKQLFYLLLEGKLNNGGTEIDKLLGTFRERKGRFFRNKVKDWLKNFKHLIVLDYEVDISPDGHLKADKNYGDIDILVLDKDLKIILSLECKDTNKAKNIHEMKKEMDNYLGREGGEGMINKHLIRHEWLAKNKDKICDFFKIARSTIIIKSFMITSEVIPTSYIKSAELKIPIISFPDLKRDGLNLLID